MNFGYFYVALSHVSHDQNLNKLKIFNLSGSLLRRTIVTMNDKFYFVLKEDFRRPDYNKYDYKRRSHKRIRLSHVFLTSRKFQIYTVTVSEGMMTDKDRKNHCNFFIIFFFILFKQNTKA